MTPDQSPHFAIHQVAEGVYAAIARPAGGAASNAGIIRIGERTVIFDTFATLAAARDLRTAAEALTGRPATYVVNSHNHPDHIHGNVIFAHDAGLIASADTRAGMAATALERMAGFRTQLTGALQRVQEQIALGHEELRQEAEEITVLLDGQPSPADLRLPDLTFTGELTLHGAGRTARLIDCGAGHTGSDAVLWLPEERILFAADLVVEGDLVLRYGDPVHWRQILDRLEGLGPRVIVPGHGEVMAGDAGIADARQYLDELSAEARRLAAAGAGEDEAALAPVPAGRSEHWYRDNLRALLRRINAGE